MRKVILKTRMYDYLVGYEISNLALVLSRVPILRMRATKSLVRLRYCAVTPEFSLLVNVKCNKALKFIWGNRADMPGKANVAIFMYFLISINVQFSRHVLCG